MLKMTPQEITDTLQPFHPFLDAGNGVLGITNANQEKKVKSKYSLAHHTAYLKYERPYFFEKKDKTDYQESQCALWRKFIETINKIKQQLEGYKCTVLITIEIICVRWVEKKESVLTTIYVPSDSELYDAMIETNYFKPAVPSDLYLDWIGNDSKKRSMKLYRPPIVSSK